MIMGDKMKKNIYAHRGYHDMKKNIPENSILAFKRAVRYGYGIELDVHLLKDKNVVVFHDHNLKRVCGINKIIEDCTYDELLNYNLFNTSQKIPLLKEVLLTVNKKVPILIETKMIKFNGELEKTVAKEISSYQGEVLMQSFNPFSVRWFKKNFPKIRRGILISDSLNQGVISIKNMTLKTFIIDFISKANFISYNAKLLPNKYISFKRSKKQIFSWTIKNNKEYEFAKEYSDYLICENMDNFK